LTAEQVERSRGWYDPRWHYENEPETRAAFDLIASNHFSRNEPGIFTPILDALLQHGQPINSLCLKTLGTNRLPRLNATRPVWQKDALNFLKIIY